MPVPHAKPTVRWCIGTLVELKGGVVKIVDFSGTVQHAYVKDVRSLTSTEDQCYE